jgi:uncharacterized small protein (DUF1192 family)
MAIMVPGELIAHPSRRSERCASFFELTYAPASGSFGSMDIEDLFPSKPDDPLAQLAKQDLDPLSLDELHARIAALEAEIARARAKIDFAVHHRASADALFKK